MRAILVSAIYQRDENIDYYLKETTALANTLDIDIVDIFTQKIDKRNNSTYLHKGKLEQIKTFIEENDIQLVIVQEEINAAIERNLTNLLKCKIVDRTNIILDIFFFHAQSKLAKTQIEIARLEYNLTKVIGSYSNLEKQGSSAVSRSSGESKAELDKRRIREQIIKLKRSLSSLEQVRDNKRKKRRSSGEPIVAIVGYTNVGKSTLLNSLTADDRHILAKDQLFATLDTSVRRIITKDYGNFLFIDTVGFVSNLPHHLIEAFASTFEEILESDVIIHLHDASDEHIDIHRQIVTRTITALKASHIPIIDVYNKGDLAVNCDEQNVIISAKLKTGYDRMFSALLTAINANKQLVSFHFPYTAMREYNYFKQSFKLETEDINESGITISVYVDLQTKQIYGKFIGDDNENIA